MLAKRLSSANGTTEGGIVVRAEKLVGLMGATISLTYISMPSLHADEIRFSNGDRISGHVVDLTASECLYRSAYYPEVAHFPLSSVVSLQTSGARVVELQNGDQIVGTIVSFTKGVLVLHSKRFGRVPLQISEVVSLKNAAEAVIKPATSGPEDATVSEGPPRQTTEPEAPPITNQAQKPRRIMSDMMTAARGRGTAPVSSSPAHQSGGSGAPATEAVPASDASSESKGTAKAQPVGQEQEEDANIQKLVFLRQSTVLLAPGQVEAEAAFGYLRNGNSSGFDVGRQITLTPTVQVGLLNRLEGSVTVPFGWSEHEVRLIDSDGSLQSAGKSTTGFGDLGLGLKYLLVPEGKTWPDVVLSWNAVAPTGNIESPLDPLHVRLGSGRWRLGGGLTVIRSYDPAILYAGVSYSHALSGEVDHFPVSGGDMFAYNFGLGFALNDRLTLSGLFQGSYVTQLNSGGRILNTNTEVFSLQSAITYRFSTGQYLEPSVTYDINQDASSVVLGLSYIQRF
jgi:hypothetical protein